MGSGPGEGGRRGARRGRRTPPPAPSPSSREPSGAGSAPGATRVSLQLPSGAAACDPERSGGPAGRERGLGAGGKRAAARPEARRSGGPRGTEHGARSLGREGVATGGRADAGGGGGLREVGGSAEPARCPQFKLPRRPQRAVRAARSTCQAEGDRRRATRAGVPRGTFLERDGVGLFFKGRFVAWIFWGLRKQLKNYSKRSSFWHCSHPSCQRPVYFCVAFPSLAPSGLRMKHNICPSSLKLCFSEKGALGKLFAALVNCKEQADRQSTLGLKEDLFPGEVGFDRW